MKEEFVCPDEIKQVGFDFFFDFEADPKKIWKLEVPISPISIKDLEWHLEIPFWNSDTGIFDLSPNKLLANPELSSNHYKRVLSADMTFPIDFTNYKGRSKIIDGLHRLAKAKLGGLSVVEARFIPLELLLKTITQE